MLITWIENYTVTFQVKIQLKNYMSVIYHFCSNNCFNVIALKFAINVQSSLHQLKTKKSLIPLDISVVREITHSYSSFKTTILNNAEVITKFAVH